MPSLAAQFKDLMKEKKESLSKVDQEVLQAMTLSELESEKIAFGETKKGMLFKEAIKDTQWTQFILSRFENSEKPEHAMFVRYVELRMNQMKKGNKETTTTIKNKAAGSIEPLPALPVDENWEEVSMPEHSSALQEEMGDLRTSNQNLNHRMGQIEMAMHQILQQLQSMSVKEEHRDAELRPKHRSCMPISSTKV